MAPNTHIIRRQTLEFRLADGQEAHALQDAASRIHSSQVISGMDEVMSRHAPEGEWLRIGRLEMDLGILDLDSLETQLPEKIRACLDEALDYQSALAVPGKVADFLDGAICRDDQPLHLAADKAALAVLAHYLNSGLTPWWHSGGVDVDRLLRQLLAEDRAGLLECLQTLHPEIAGKRLARQLGDATLATLLAALLDEDESTWQHEVRDWELLLSSVAQGNAGPTPVFSHALLPVLLAEACPLPLTPEHARQKVFFQVVAGFEHVPGLSPQERLGSLRTGARDRLQADSPVLQRLESLTNERESGKELAASATAAISQVPSTGVDDAREAGPAKQRSGKHDSVEKKPEAKAEMPPGITDIGIDSGQHTSNQIADARPSAQPGGGGDGDAVQDAADTHVTSSLSQDQHGDNLQHQTEQQQALLERVSELSEGYFLDNAGLVLLWPFLPGFFRQLGLADKQDFLTPQNRERAVLLSSFLTDGQTRCQENRLLLNKLLCGWPLLDPLVLELQPSDREISEVEDLLGSIIGHWQTLGNTSIEGFRQAFLQRQGRLLHDDMGWLLTVDRAAHDVLLDSLPWGLGLISLPWMVEPIRVEW